MFAHRGPIAFLSMVVDPKLQRPADIAEHRLVVSLPAMTFLLWIGASAIVPLLPTYLHGHGASTGLVGVVMASYFALSVVTQYPAGRLTDRFGARAVIVAGLAIFVAGSVGFAIQSGALPAIAYRSAQGIGAGAASVASAAMVAAHVGAARRGRAFALLYGSQSLALAVGPLVGGFVGASSMRVLFFGAAALACIAATPVLVALSPPASVPGGEPHAEQHVAAAPIRSEHYNRALLGALAVFAGTGLLGGLYESVWSLLLASRGATSVEIGLSWTMYCLPFALLSAPAGRLADRNNRKTLVLVGVLTSGLFALWYPEIHSVAYLVVLGCLDAVGGVLVTPAALSMLAEWTPGDRHGAAQGALATSRTAATALAAAGCGALFGVAKILPFAAVALGLVVLGGYALFAWRGLPARALDGAPASEPPRI
jgi:DHA1 family multidrug resistance protein-like MFS transporter